MTKCNRQKSRKKRLAVSVEATTTIKETKNPEHKLCSTMTVIVGSLKKNDKQRVPEVGEVKEKVGTSTGTK